MREYLDTDVAQAAAFALRPLDDDPALERSAVCALAGAGGRHRRRCCPRGLQVDTFQGSAWLGIVPFWLDRHQGPRRAARSPERAAFPISNLRTYVRDQHTGTPGVYCFSLDASNLLAVAAARTFFHLPYHWAEMRLEQRSEREFSFYSRQAVFQPAGDLQGALPGAGAGAQAGGGPQRGRWSIS